MRDAFAELNFELRWVAWRNEMRGGRMTKVPYSPHGDNRAKADDPTTWNTRSAAEARAGRKGFINGLGGGIGIELGDLGDGTSIGGIDLDTCRSPDGVFEPWANDVIRKFSSYTEVSPSGTGAKIFFRYVTADLPQIREAMGGPLHGREFKRGNGRDHPPAIELHISNRYFTVTEQTLADTPGELRLVDASLLLWLIHQAGPAFAGSTTGTGGTKSKGSDKSRSAIAFRKGAAMRRAGKTFKEMCEALRDDPDTAEWYRDKGEANGKRELHRIWTKAGDNTYSGAGTSFDDFWAFMPMHDYIHVPTRGHWPAASVNRRLPPVKLTDRNGDPVINDAGEQVTLSAAAWLDEFKPVEQVTWAPGLGLIVRDRYVFEGGWVAHLGGTCFNLYRPPAIAPGNAHDVGRWLDLIEYVFPDDAEHLINWLAHRVQRPQEKINHALVLGGEQGIGKDTILEPVKYAIGPWNLKEASPSQVLGRFNGFLKSVILRISEARDLGEFDRFKFYDHMKTIEAAPPDVLRVDEKHLREHDVFNVCGVIVTTNHKNDGIYLPTDDRRHFVAWSDRKREDAKYQDDYWSKLYAWYFDGGGIQNVAAFLMRRDLSEFDPKAPPKKTPAFWAIADANRSPEEPELADLIDLLGNPNALTLASLQGRATSDFADWLIDRKNRRIIPHRLEKCGYAPVRNPDAESGLWVINSKRQAVYAKSGLSLRDQIAAISELIRPRNPR